MGRFRSVLALAIVVITPVAVPAPASAASVAWTVEREETHLECTQEGDLRGCAAFSAVDPVGRMSLGSRVFDNDYVGYATDLNNRSGRAFANGSLVHQLRIQKPVPSLTVSVTIRSDAAEVEHRRDTPFLFGGAASAGLVQGVELRCVDGNQCMYDYELRQLHILGTEQSASLPSGVRVVTLTVEPHAHVGGLLRGGTLVNLRVWGNCSAEQFTTTGEARCINDFTVTDVVVH